jgi:CRISPR type IV-associated protein Csf3
MAYRDRFQFEPLRITAHLRTNVIADRWLPLDGILLYQACRAQLGPQAMTTPGGMDNPLGASTLPLAIIHPGRREWYYACSWAQPQPWWVTEGQDHWNKRIDVGFADLIDFQGRRGKVIVEQGAYKAYHMPVFYRVADRIDWYCVGDRIEIERLLSTVTHLGKKAAQGWGRVREWVIESWPVDWSAWREGHLTRGVPLEDAAGARDLLLYGVRPSYYRSNNQMLLVLPDDHDA